MPRHRCPLAIGAALLAAWLVILTAACRPAEPTTVILVRHAEREAVEGRDPPLSAAGRERALSLRDALADAGVTAILTTRFQRTRQTAAPLAEALGITPRVIETAADVDAHVAAVTEAVRALPPGSRALVVGHSNTLPPIIRALGGSAPAALADSVFDAIFVVSLSPAGARTIQARYGAPSPPAE